MLGNIIFKGIDSNSFGLKINFENISIKPTKRNQVISVIGKDGAQIFTDKHDVYEIVLDCRLNDNNVIGRRFTTRQITAWLQGYGDLVLGIEDDIKYTAYALNNITTNPLFTYESFSISFLVQPIKRSRLEIENLTWDQADFSWESADVPWTGVNFTYENIAPGDVLNIETMGNYESLPTLVISGQATTLSLTDDNGQQFTFENLNGTIYVDSENLLVYSGDNPKVNEIQNSNRTFITLNIGNNTIDVDGSGFVNLTIQFKNVSAYI